MIKRAIIVGLGAILGMQIAIRVGRKMRDHCEQMAEHCRQMATQFERRSKVVGT